MSRVGSSAITIPADVTLSNDGGVIVVKGKNGELSASLHNDVELTLADNVATLAPVRDTRQAKALWGTMRANLRNMVLGVSEGFTRKLEINGVGYRAAMQGNKLVLSLGFSHPVEMEVPAGLKVAVENNTSVTITGADKPTLAQCHSAIAACAALPTRSNTTGCVDTDPLSPVNIKMIGFLTFVPDATSTERPLVIAATVKSVTG